MRENSKRTGGKKALSGQSVSEKKCADGAWLRLFFLSSVDRKTDPLVIVLFKTRVPDTEEVKKRNTRGRRLNGAKFKSKHGSFNVNFVECELRMRRLGAAG